MNHPLDTTLRDLAEIAMTPHDALSQKCIQIWDGDLFDELAGLLEKAA